MAFSYQPPGSRFRESLTFQDILNHAIEAWRIAIADGDSREIKSTTEAMVLLITPGIRDPIFSAQAKSLEAEEEVKFALKWKEYKQKLFKARNGCPDLVEKPSEVADVEHWKKLGAL